MNHSAIIIIIIALYLCGISAFANTNLAWTWVTGNNQGNQYGRYGVLGSANTTNAPGGRDGAVGWYDGLRQEFWLFGGYGNAASGTGFLNDLWRYRVNDSTWTWMGGDNTRNRPGSYGVKGIPSPNNYPGGRHDAFGWYDSQSQELWLFGGKGYGNSTSPGYGFLNDLWRYRLNDSTWTWISGRSTINQVGVYGTRNTPGVNYVPAGRYNARGWYDNSRGELWLFGGYGTANSTSEGYFNDLWRFRMNDSTWTWIHGSNKANQPGGYGSMYTPHSSNVPGARYGAVGWYDSLRQEFWLFGGFGYTNSTAVNDSTWTWMAGSHIINQPGVYGEKGNASTANIPGARYTAVGWYDSSTHELWLFGGQGIDSFTNSGHLNDLWRYQVNELTWTWIAGSNSTDQVGVYGEKGIASTDNYPGARAGAAGWYDSLRQEFWLFGGYGYARAVSSDGAIKLSDFWKAMWEEEKCPPLYQRINNTCIPLIHCSSSEDTQANCLLECNQTLASNFSSAPQSYDEDESSCVIEGDMVVNRNVSQNNSTAEPNSVTVVGVVNVTGSVVVADEMRVRLPLGSVLHVGKCLVIEEGSEMVIVVEGGMNTNEHVVATYNRDCSSSEIVERVRIEQTPSYDECRDDKPIVEEKNEEDGRARLELLFVSSDSSECNRTSKINILAIAIAIPAAVLVVVVIVIAMTVPKLRAKILPTKHYSSLVKKKENG